ncbi:hypothetical protein OROMI_030029 [Orobanche minor]
MLLAMFIMDKLREFNEVFSMPNSYEISLHSALKTPEDRTIAVGAVIKSLRELVSPGVQNESDDEADYDQLHPVMSSFDSEPFFSIERAVVPYFGIKTYGVHMNGYVEYDGEKYMWIGKRSESEPTYPGMLENLVCGELPQGTSCQDHLVKLCEEEAGIMSSIASQAISVGVVSYTDIEGYRCKRDIMFCYDTRLSPRFVPKNQSMLKDKKQSKNVAIARVVRDKTEGGPKASVEESDLVKRMIKADKIFALAKQGELKDAFAEYRRQKKKEEEKERCAKLEKAREDFKNMFRKGAPANALEEDNAGGKPTFHTLSLSSTIKVHPRLDGLTVAYIPPRAGWGCITSRGVSGLSPPWAFSSPGLRSRRIGAPSRSIAPSHSIAAPVDRLDSVIPFSRKLWSRAPLVVKFVGKAAFFSPETF